MLEFARLRLAARPLGFARKFSLVAAALVVGLAASTAAFGLPWDVDMVDGQNVKGYEQLMRPLPEGVVSQPSVISPKSYQPVYAPTSPEAAALTSPYDDGVEMQAEGHKMYDIYCTPCHGDGVKLGALSLPNRVPIIPQLAGPNGRLSGLEDGRVYMTIREGSPSKIMPSYGYTMTDREQWSIVHYLRTLDNGAFKPKVLAPAEGTGTPQ